MVSGKRPRDFRRAACCPDRRLNVSLEASAIRTVAVTSASAASAVRIAGWTALWIPAIVAAWAEDRGAARSTPRIFASPVAALARLSSGLVSWILAKVLAACVCSEAAHAHVLVGQQRRLWRNCGLARDDGVVAVPLIDTAFCRLHRILFAAGAVCPTCENPRSIRIEPSACSCGRGRHRVAPKRRKTSLTTTP